MLAAALAVLVSLPTIPAVREWHAGHGELRVARRGGVVLALGSRDRRLAAARLPARCRFACCAHRGAHFGAPLYGTRTALQQLLRGGDGAVPARRARDWPRYPERGLMIDNGRRYYSPAWLERRIRELALPEAEPAAPALLRRPRLPHRERAPTRRSWPGPHLTKPRCASRGLRTRAPRPRDRRARHARSHAAPRGVPIRSPGGRAADELDFTKPAARRFARELILEYLQLFPAATGTPARTSTCCPPTTRCTRSSSATPGPRAAPTPSSASSTGSTGWCARADGRCGSGTTVWPTGAR